MHMRMNACLLQAVINVAQYVHISGVEVKEMIFQIFLDFQCQS